MRDFDISQLPVMENEEWVGSVGEQQVISALLKIVCKFHQ